jgi:serine/threonine protein kinase
VPGYRLRRLLGRGAFGEVWGADGPGEPVALKFLRCVNGSRPAQETRSIETVRQLKHPNLVQVGNIWAAPGYLVVAMELADGTLQDLLEAYRGEFGTPIPAEDLCPCLAQAAAALDFLNARAHHLDGRCVGLQHRDVKPSNLLVFGETVKLSDFSLTTPMTGTVAAQVRQGTPGYAAPEVFRGQLSDRTDQYALAVTYCELRCGRLPFPERAPATRLNGDWPEPDLTMLAEAERPLIARALTPVPQDRWPSCGELMAQLQNLATPPQQMPSGASGSSRDKRDRRACVRHACRIRISGRLLGNGNSACWEGIIRDVSKSGLNLITRTEFEKGTILVMKLQDRNGKWSREVYVRVVRAASRPGGEWLMGCTFARKRSDAEIRSFI